MAYIRVIHEDEADGKLFELYDEIQRNRGRVSNILRIQSLAPKAMRAHLDVYMATCFSKGGLTRREVEVIAVAVSAANGDPYGTAHHKEGLLRYAGDKATVDAIAKDPAKNVAVGRERALVEYALALTQQPAKGVKAQADALRKAGLTDEEVLQAAQVVAYFNFANRIAIGLGVDLEPDGDRDYHY